MCLERLLEFLAWLLGCLQAGQFPEAPFPGTVFTPRGRRFRGTEMAFRGHFVSLKADWEYLQHMLQMSAPPKQKNWVPKPSPGFKNHTQATLCSLPKPSPRDTIRAPAKHLLWRLCRAEPPQGHHQSPNKPSALESLQGPA
jgi:hypothetical protein